ncbi:MAG: hypothetical protein ACLUNO_01025 [Oscillospiraceae bacterium]
MDYLSAQNGCSTPGALREVLGVSAPRTAAMLRRSKKRCCAAAPIAATGGVSWCAHDGTRPADGGAGACGAVRACAVRASGSCGEQDARGLIRLLEPHHGDRGSA